VIFADCDLLRLERDEADPGIFVAVRIPEDPEWEPLDLSGWALWSVHSDTRRMGPEEEPSAPATTLDDLDRGLDVVNALRHELAALREDQSRDFADAQAAMESIECSETAKRAAEAEAARVKSEIDALYATRTFRWTSSARRLYGRMLTLVGGRRSVRS